MIFSVIPLHWWGNRGCTEELFQWSDVCSRLTDENWVAGELLFIQSGFHKQWRDGRFLESGMKLAGSERKVEIIGDCWNSYAWTFFEMPGGDGSESDCLFDSAMLSVMSMILNLSWSLKTHLASFRANLADRRYCNRRYCNLSSHKFRLTVLISTSSSISFKCEESYLFSKGKETEGMGKRLKWLWVSKWNFSKGKADG